MIQAKELYTLPSSLPFEDFFDGELFPWEWLPKIKQALEHFDFQSLGEYDPMVKISGDVYIHSTVRILGPCVIQGPAYIGANVEIRPGAFIRGNVIVGEGSVLGNSCEYKNCLLMEGVESAHFNYVGDSILGNKAHLGAGVICANLRLDRQEVIIRIGSEKIATGLRKVGSFLGDGAEVGCNSVLQPGSVLGKNSAVISMPFHGYLPEGKMIIPEIKSRILSRPGFLSLGDLKK